MVQRRNQKETQKYLEIRMLQNISEKKQNNKYIY